MNEKKKNTEWVAVVGFSHQFIIRCPKIDNVSSSFPLVVCVIFCCCEFFSRKETLKWKIEED